MQLDPIVNLDLFISCVVTELCPTVLLTKEPTPLGDWDEAHSRVSPQ